MQARVWHQCGKFSRRNSLY